ncbi:mRNA cleavage and polyadenylation factor subunit [Elasticomyces elasticus]|nr:mRNA cleavage and polyadenylation factor subunit [Elasticomyces elasticus]
MQCYTEVLPPTAVTHAISLPFVHAKANNLIVAKTALLQVFEVRSIVPLEHRIAPDQRRGSKDQSVPDAEDASQRTESISKLVLVAEYPLSGTVTSLARVKALNTKSGGEALLVAVRDAKISLVEWDPENYTLSTISIHYYEGDSIHTAPWASDLTEYPSYLTVDPSSRCAALKFGARHLAILPFRQTGDDLVEEEYEAVGSPPPKAASPQTLKDIGSDQHKKETPYSASFVLPLTALDPSLTHPIHLAFLHEYREPTFGIVSSTKAASSALLEERKDILTYSVFTLDLEQRASTTLLSVTNLPYDIFRVIPLAAPIGGALLVGSNELVHVDQAGKTNAVAVNDFAKQCSSFPMSDQSGLGLRLEGCEIEQLSQDGTDMLVVLNTGETAILSFKIDGRSVSGLSVHPIAADRGGLAIRAAASCTAPLGRGRLFIGSEDGDSVVLGWQKRTAQFTRKRSHAQMLAEDEELSFSDEDFSDDDVDDDLYGGDPAPAKAAVASPTTGTTPDSYVFRVHDVLPCLGPMRSVCFGAPTTTSAEEGQEGREDVRAPLELVAAVGRGRASGLAVLNREIGPRVLHTSDMSDARGLWTVSAKKTTSAGDAAESTTGYDQYLIEGGETVSKVYSFDGLDTKEVTGTEFEGEGAIVDMGVLASGTRIVHIQKSEVRTYDSDLGLSQILPILDESDAELRIVATSFADPYLMLLREDDSVQILEADASGDLDDVEVGEETKSMRWLSGCLFRPQGEEKIFGLPDLSTPVQVFSTLSSLPPVVSADYVPRRAQPRETLIEILVADLGDASLKSPYMILRSATDDLVFYEPFHYPLLGASSTPTSFTQNLRFRKVSNAHTPKYMETEDASLDKASPLRILADVGGYCAVFMPGVSPSLVLKTTNGPPRVINLRGKGVRSLTGLDTDACQNGFAYVDITGTLRQCTLSDDKSTQYDLGWVSRRIRPFRPGHDLSAIAYFEPNGLYALASSQNVGFTLPAEDLRQDVHEKGEHSLMRRDTSFLRAAGDPPFALWFHSDTEIFPPDLKFQPLVPQSSLHLFEPGTSTIIDTHTFAPSEYVTSLQVMTLEASEQTHVQRPLIVAGTTFLRGEDLAAKGGLYVFDVVRVVPEIDKPETGRKLKLISREDIRGAVSAIAPLGKEGFIGVGQGQKLTVRGLKEDGSCLPVAFLDVQCYVSSLKSLKDSNFWLMGDAWKGLWFGGFTEEPYKLTMFGKSRSKMEVVVAEFLPYNDQLYIVVVDAECDLHVLQYDPENPKSLSGQRLLHKSTFHLGHWPTSMTLLPSTVNVQPSQAPTNGVSETQPPAPPLFHVLITTQSGALATLTPLNEPEYRRLGALQTHLTSVLDHAAGLNPRAYRAAEGEAGGGFGARGVIDGGLLRRVAELGVGRRGEVMGRSGGEMDGGLLVGGDSDGLGYL